MNKYYKTSKICSSSRFLLTTVLTIVLVLGISSLHAQSGISVSISTSSISASADANVSLTVRVAGPSKFSDQQRGDTGSVTWYLPATAPDGSYRYDVFGASGEEGTDAEVSYRQSGSFDVQGGQIIAPGGGEAATIPVTEQMHARQTVNTLISSIIDFLIPSAHAVDSFISSGVPTVFFDDINIVGQVNEWSIEQRECAAAGSLCFGLIDLVNGNQVFDIRGSANNLNSLVIDPNGNIDLADDTMFLNKINNRIGIGTVTPLRNLHIFDVAPAIALQDSTGITWTLNNNSSSSVFDIHWNNGGSNQSPFVIRALAPADSLYVLDNGDIGMGTNAPASALHVSRQEDAQLLVQNAVAPTAPGDVTMFELRNTGSKIVRFKVNAGGANSIWTFDNDPNYNGAAGINSGRFRIAKSGTGVAEFTVDGFGNGIFLNNSFAVNHVNTSSREFKTAFKALNQREVLDKLASLPVTEWQYKQDGSRHYGPVAEEFQETFGLGDGKHISTVDTAGVTMAAIQGLYQVVQGKDAEIEALKKDNKALAERLAALETLVLSKQVASAE